MTTTTDALDHLLKRVVDRNSLARHGLAALATVDGTVIWRGAYGDLDAKGTPASVTARYPIASVTKLFTATVTLRLCEQGKLAVTDRLVDHVDPASVAKLHVIDGTDYTPHITIEHLLSHTSGLPDYYEEAPGKQLSPQQRLLAGEDTPVPYDDVIRIVQSQLKPHFPPQALDGGRVHAHYADTNYQLLGAVIESVTGQALDTVFASMLFDPLGLDNTSSYPNPPRSGRPATPDASVFSPVGPIPVDGALRHQKADGGIVSTLDDQLRFLTAVVRGDVFDDAEMWQWMQQRTARIFFPIRYGRGVMVYAPARWMSLGRRTPPVIGHTGSTATWLMHSPEDGLVLAGTFDCAWPALPFRFIPRLLQVARR